MKKILKFFSFIYPVRVQRSESEVNGVLEVFLENGKKVLNGANSNYSFGRLHQVFARGFRHFKLPWPQIREVLILGYGGGSVAHLLKKQREFNGNITAVELDQAVVNLARKHFPEALERVEVHLRDALFFLQETPGRYDLIVVDLFIDNKVPEPFKDEVFIKQLKLHLNRNGHVIHNFMFTDIAERKKVMEVYRQNFLRIDHMELFGSNTLIYAAKVWAQQCHTCPTGK